MLLKKTFRAFRHRDYAILWWSLLLGNTTGLIQTTAQARLIFQLTHSLFYLGLDGLCLGLPRVIFSPLGGAVVDRANRSTVFHHHANCILLTTLFLSVMVYLDAIRVWHVLTVSAFTGFFLSFEQPVRQSIVHHLVPRSELPNSITLFLLMPWEASSGSSASLMIAIPSSLSRAYSNSLDWLMISQVTRDFTGHT
jgi:Transmembrane secretion effector